MPAFEDRFDDVRGEEGCTENPADVPLVHAELAGERTQGLDFTRHQSLVPDAAACHSLDEGGVDPGPSFAPGVRRYDQPNRGTAAADLCINPEDHKCLVVRTRERGVLRAGAGPVSCAGVQQRRSQPLLRQSDVDPIFGDSYA